MPEFVHPFSGVIPDRKLTFRELTRTLRLSLSAEEEAVHLYEALADATDHELAKAVLQEIANEERVHAGEFQRLLNLLLDDEERWMSEGADEVNELRDRLASPPASEPSAASADHPPTIGNLKS